VKASPGDDPGDALPPDMAIKADIVAWVGKLDAAVEQLCREIDRLPGLIEGERRGAHREPDRRRPGPA
jgi:hypothetical protein